MKGTFGVVPIPSEWYSIWRNFSATLHTWIIPGGYYSPSLSFSDISADFSEAPTINCLNSNCNHFYSSPACGHSESQFPVAYIWYHCNITISSTRSNCTMSVPYCWLIFTLLVKRPSPRRQECFFSYTSGVKLIKKVSILNSENK